MITKEIKQRILAAVAANRVNYPSDAKHAAALGLNTSIYSGLKNGQTEKMLSDANWISIARSWRWIFTTLLNGSLPRHRPTSILPHN